MVEAVTMNSSALTITKRSAARALIFPAGISRAKTMQSNTCKSSTTQPYLPEQSEEIPSVRSA